MSVGKLRRGVMLVMLACLFSISGPAFATPPSAHEAPVGSVVMVEGGVGVMRGGKGKEEILAAGEPVFIHDRIKTYHDGRALVLFIDGSELTLAQASSFTIDDFVFDTDRKDENRGLFTHLHGAFLFVSGLLTKKSNPDVRFNSVFGNIGIRGTTLWAGEVEHGASYRVIVQKGTVAFETGGGEVVLQTRQFSTATSPKAAPQLARDLHEDEVNARVVRSTFPDTAILRDSFRQAREKQAEMRTAHREYLEKQRAYYRKLREEQGKQRRDR